MRITEKTLRKQPDQRHTFISTKKTLIMIIRILAICCLLSFQSRGEIYYVSNNGSDANAGLDWNNAFETIQRSVQMLSPGDSVYVAPGNYEGFDVRDIDGLPGSPIVFYASGDQITIDAPGPIRDDGINVENADYIVIDGFTCINMPGSGNGIRLVLSDHCEVRNCFCENNAERGIFTGFTDDILIEYNTCTSSIDEHGIYVSNSSDRPIIRYNTCYNNNNIGIHMNGDASLGGDGIISDAQIYGNRLFNNNLAAGLNMDGVVGAKIYNNLIYNNHTGQGIAMFQGDGAIVSQAAEIYNNTIVVPSDGRWGILLRDGAQLNTKVYNNIIINLHSWRGSIATEDTAGLSSDYNLLSDKMSWEGDGTVFTLAEWQNLNLDENSVVNQGLNAVFEDFNNGVLELISGSPAIDAGQKALTESLVIEDIVGLPRPQGREYDMGCFEKEQISTSSSTIVKEYLIYPNPVIDILRVRSLESKTLKSYILDEQGRLVYSTSSIDNLDVSFLVPGTYYLLQNTEGNISQLIPFVKADH